MKLNSKVHGVVDYLVVIFLLASPTLFNLPELTSKFTYALAAVHLLLTIFTNFELGIVKMISLTIHGYVELAVSIVLIGVAFYFGNLEGSTALFFYMGFAIAVFLTWVLTDYSKITNVAH